MYLIQIIIVSVLRLTVISSILILFILLLKKTWLKNYNKNLNYYIWLFAIFRLIIPIEIPIKYTFSKKTLRSLYLTNLRIYVACDNVYYWSKRKGFDSRVTWNGNKDSSGEYSAVRAFSAGLSLQF